MYYESIVLDTAIFHNFSTCPRTFSLKDANLSQIKILVISCVKQIQAEPITQPHYLNFR